MSKRMHILGCVVLAVVLPLAGVRADDDPAKAAKSKGPGSMAAQLLLKERLDKLAKGTLVAQLDRNRAVYVAMTPQQRRDLREKVYSFLKENPDRQVKILQAAGELLNQTDAEKVRTAWLTKVVASLSEQEKARLREMSPDERAKRLLELKAELDPEPATTTQPATTQPAD
ncbi:MAG TPA: hypothetical protein VFJ30_01730 [Phycisphaerae bacterium]|nr:hypothetical protein [Phycisphaerae bacterium]